MSNEFTRETIVVLIRYELAYQRSSDVKDSVDVGILAVRHASSPSFQKVVGVRGVFLGLPTWSR